MINQRRNNGTVLSYIFGNRPQFNHQQQLKAEIIKSVVFVFISSLFCTCLIYGVYFLGLLFGVERNSVISYLSSNSINGLFFTSVILIISYYLAYYFTFKRTDNIIKEIKVKDAISVKQNKFIICLIGYGFAMLGNLISALACTGLEYIASFFDSNVQSTVNNSTNGGYLNYSPFESSIFGMLILFIFTVIIPPITEEIIFRKVMYEHLNVFNPKISVLLTSILFGFFHGNIQQITFGVFAGFGFVLIKKYTGNLKYCILVHTLVNLSAFIVQYLSNNNNTILICSNIFIILSASIAVLLFAFNETLIKTVFKQISVPTKEE